MMLENRDTILKIIKGEEATLGKGEKVTLMKGRHVRAYAVALSSINLNDCNVS